MFPLILPSTTEIMFAINEIKIPNALIESPIISNEFVLIRITAKYMKIIKLIRCEIKEKESPSFILC